LNDHFELAGRLSVLKSDGYIDRASSDLKSYFLQGTYIGKTTLIRPWLLEVLRENLSVLEWSRDLDKLKMMIEHLMSQVFIQTNLGTLVSMIMKPIITSKIIINCIGMKS
jgi:hypothetical protein